MSLLGKILFSAVATLIVVCLTPDATKADTITFNPLELPGVGGTPANPYTELGFTFSSKGISTDPFALASAQQGNTNRYAGSAGLALSFHLDSFRLTHGGTGFSLNSIDLSRRDLLETGTVTVIFTGHFVGGGTTVEAFTFSQFGFQTFTFNPSFTNLDFVDFGSDSFITPLFQIDNVVVNAPIPEPATMLLLGTGLASVVGAMGRRRRPF